MTLPQPMPQANVSQSGPAPGGKSIGAVCLDGGGIGDGRDVMPEERPCDGAVQLFQEGEERRNSILTVNDSAAEDLCPPAGDPGAFRKQENGP